MERKQPRQLLACCIPHVFKAEKSKFAIADEGQISNTEENRFHIDHVCNDHHSSDSCFQKLLQMGLPCNEYCVEQKLCWLRSQIIGYHAEFISPFGRRKLVYADHTASARSLHFSEAFITHHLLPFYGNIHTCDSYVGSRTTKMVQESVEYIKKCLGGGEDDALILCGSGTTAAIKRLQEVMGIAVPSILRERVLKSLDTEERWVVFVGPHEHHSNLLSWRQSLAEVVEIGLDHKGLLDMDALKLQLETYKDTKRPMLGSFSACSNVTGIYSDTSAIAQLLRHYKAFACFDFAASGPYAEIKMRSGQIDGYDAVFLSPHKFIGGPDSPGVLLMNKALYRLRSSPPSTCGGGTVDYVNGFNDKTHSTANSATNSSAQAPRPKLKPKAPLKTAEYFADVGSNTPEGGDTCKNTLMPELIRDLGQERSENVTYFLRTIATYL
ncbi:hypothetical protein Fmac_004210 [Flemingia macrophylla]|uniref:Aminotransferase class V domain-containing protein n=1 Tax=Flemingia macrophylla TaxID=520843 RepID=A0ABD1N4D5_9FABA